MMVPSLDVVLDVVWPFLLRMTDSYVLWFAFLIMVVYFRQLMNRFAHASVRVISVMIGGDKSRLRQEYNKVNNKKKIVRLAGPRSFPFVGSAMALFQNQGDLDQMFAVWIKQFGKIFNMQLFVGIPAIVIADANLARQVFLKKHTWFVNRPAPSNLERFIPGTSAQHFFRWSMTVVKDAEWRSVRRAATAVFHSNEILNRFSPAVNEAAKRLVNDLKALWSWNDTNDVDEDERFVDVEIWRKIGETTLEVICSTVMGLETSNTSEASRTRHMELLKSARAVFANSGFAANPYLLIAGAVPKMFSPILGLIARTFPTQQMRDTSKALETIDHYANELLDEAIAQVQCEEKAPPLTAEPASWPVPPPRLELQEGESIINLMYKMWAHDKGLKSTATAAPRIGPALRREWAQAIRAQAALFFIAGYETTANTLSFTLYLLARHIDWFHAIQAEVDEHHARKNPGGQLTVTHDDAQTLFPKTMACIREAIRLFPPAPVTSRVCSPPSHAASGTNGAWLDEEDETVVSDDGGITKTTKSTIFVPKNADVFIAIRAIHLDPQMFSNPRTFDPQRFLPPNKEPYAWFPFGLGPRQCVATKLALTEAVTVLAHFARSFDLKAAYVAPGEDDLEGLETKMAGTLGPTKGVHLRIRPRCYVFKPNTTLTT
ncbi:thromboxane-A synthase [Pycnococcus provasolii]|uniref:Thromboxane-A synthase n=1 Tax=Pycnococcus provasolii TaxID=41880 RepID=A0A830HL17_9CHLO|nr:thromboxane-A synthase [Pycnococcus provasolii]